MFFSNISQTKGFRGTVGFGIKELNRTENDYFCIKKSKVISLKDLPLSNKNVNFSCDFGLRSFTSGCYYLDSSGNWSTGGVEVYEDTNLTHTHCGSTHLTQFAGGFVVLPPAIDFGHVFANASFLQNPTIYSTIITLTSLYIILAILSRYLDVKDKKKIGITNLANKYAKYLYEVTIYTGTRFDAGTESNVIFFYFKLFNLIE